jgi:hypothetical protein
MRFTTCLHAACCCAVCTGALLGIAVASAALPTACCPTYVVCPLVLSRMTAPAAAPLYLSITGWCAPCRCLTSSSAAQISERTEQWVVCQWVQHVATGTVIVVQQY